MTRVYQCRWQGQERGWGLRGGPHSDPQNHATITSQKNSTHVDNHSFPLITKTLNSEKTSLSEKSKGIFFLISKILVTLCD